MRHSNVLMSGYFPLRAAETADSRSDVWVNLQIRPLHQSHCDNCEAAGTRNAVKGTLTDISWEQNIINTLELCRIARAQYINLDDV